MLILGLLVAAVGALLVLAAVFTAEVTARGQLELLGIGVGAATLFILGVVAGLAILLGLWLAKTGARRELRQRKENKKMEKLSEKLDRADADRRRDLDDEPDRSHG